MIAFGAVFGVIFLRRHLGKQRPGIRLGISLVLVAAAFVGELRYGERALFWLALWFFAIGVGIILFRLGLVEIKGVKKLEWERFAPTFLIFPLGIYATQVYGKIKPFYGGGIARDLGELHCPTLMFFCDRDEYVPMSDVDAVRAAHGDAEVVVYPGAEHGFMRDGSENYHEAAATDAWSRMLAFFGEHLD